MGKTSKVKIIYDNRGKQVDGVPRPGRFLPSWDSTDHLYFVCKQCKTVADLLLVKSYGYVIIFSLQCPECKTAGQRKMYLTVPLSRRCFCHCVYDPDEQKVYSYGREPSPYGSVPLRPKLEEDME